MLLFFFYPSETETTPSQGEGGPAYGIYFSRKKFDDFIEELDSEARTTALFKELAAEANTVGNRTLPARITTRAKQQLKMAAGAAAKVAAAGTANEQELIALLDSLRKADGASISEAIISKANTALYRAQHLLKEENE